MIKIDHLTFGYSKKKLLFEDLNLTLKAGHIYGLLGKNGAGKSTLLKNISGLAFPLKGTCEVNGHVSGNRTPQFLEEMFFIPEEIYLPSSRIRDFMKNTSIFYPKFNTEQFLNYLKEFEIDSDVRINNLSFGQQKKVMISFGLATNAGVLVLDEPTNGLDIPSKVQFRKIVASAMADNRCIIISTHQVRDLDNLIDSLIIIHDRKMVLNRGVDEVADKLMFTTRNDIQHEDVIYAEQTMLGYNVIQANKGKNSGKVDLELLFNAVIADPGKINNGLN